MAREVTAAFRAAMEANSRSPRQIAAFLFPVAGTKFLSDQQLPSPFAGYNPLIVEWGDLVDMAGGDPQDDQASEIRQMSITIWNGGEDPFSDLFLTEQPENVIVQVYQWFDGLAFEDLEMIDRFVIQDPIAYDEVSSLLRLDLVSLSMRYDRPIGDIITTADYPLASTEAIGKEIPIIIGTPGKVETIQSQKFPVATLNGSILKDTLSIAVNESLNDLDFPGQGSIEINGEIVRYFFRFDKSFEIATPPLAGRGFDNTTAEEHITGAEIKLILDSKFIVCKGPIQEIPVVKVAGAVADPSDYSISLNDDPVIISFSGSPKAVTFATGATFLEMQFDATNSESTAFQAFAAFEGEENLAARLTETESLLSIKQVTLNPDRGQIVKAFLAIEHWEDGAFLNDFAEVSIEGIGVVGRLSRPSPESVISLDAEVDIDHGHSHNISGEHTHDFTDPALAVTNPLHGHGTTGTTTGTFAPAGAIPTTFVVATKISPGATTTFTVKGFKVFTFSGLPGAWINPSVLVSVSSPSGTAPTTVSVYNTLARANVGQNFLGRWTIPSNGVATVVSIGNYNLATAYIRIETQGTASIYNPSFTVGVNAMSLTVSATTTILPAGAGVSVNTAISGSNVVSTDKADDDVQDLTTGNATILDVDSDVASSTVVNLFDITETVDFDWAWFTDRDVTIDYQGTNDNRKIYIRHIFFDVEYRKKETVFSDQVTCEPVGLIDDTFGSITGTPNKLIQSPEEVRKYVLVNRGGLPSSFIDSTSFASAASAYAGLAYAFDGVLDGGLTVRDAEKKLAFQCRSRWFWNEGLAKITLREKAADQTAAKFLNTSDLQLRSIRVERQRATDISNIIDLQYSKDWTDAGDKPFKKTTSDSDLDSISVNGNYEHRDKFQFDMVVGESMAADLLDYYIDTQATPSTFYNFNVYLKHFDLEKGDVIGVSSPFAKLIKTLMEIKSIDRLYGSGRNRSITRLRVTAESLKYTLVQIGLEDAVSVLDAISINFADSLELSDILFTGDEISFSITGQLLDVATVSDVIETISNFVTVLTETVTFSEAASFDVGVALVDEQFAVEVAVVQIVIGYGGGGFGTGVRFGGLTLVTELLGDLVVASEVIKIDQTTTLVDELTTITEQIVLSGGFGTPVGDGFGGSLYGS